MFCSWLKPNHSAPVFFARKTEINLFISLSLTNKPYTQLTHYYHCLLLSDKTPIFLYFSVHMPNPLPAKTKTLKCFSHRLAPTKRRDQRWTSKFTRTKGSKIFFKCQFLCKSFYCSQWGCDVADRLLMLSSFLFLFPPKLKLQPVCVGFSSIFNNCSGLPVLTCTDVHMPTPKLKPFPSFPYSPPHDRIPMWEMSQQLRGKANQRNLLPVQKEVWPLDWGARNVSRSTKRQQIKKRCESELGQGWRPGTDHGIIREEGMRPSFLILCKHTRKKNKKYI